MESTAHHGLSCRRSGGRISRHQSANENFHRALVSGGIPEVLEPVGVAREDGKRPYGMSLIPWEEGRPALSYGILLVVTLWLSAIETKLLWPRRGCGTAESLKIRKYSSLTSTYSFAPICIETMGAWGEGEGYYQKDWTKSAVGYRGVSIYSVSHPTFGHRCAQRKCTFHHGNNPI